MRVKLSLSETDLNPRNVRVTFDDRPGRHVMGVSVVATAHTLTVDVVSIDEFDRGGNHKPVCRRFTVGETRLSLTVDGEPEELPCYVGQDGAVRLVSDDSVVVPRR